MRIPAVIVLLFPLSVQAQVSYPAKQAVTVNTAIRTPFGYLKLLVTQRPKE